jgi:hypothetical protein
MYPGFGGGKMKRVLLIGALTVSLLPVGCARNYSPSYNPNYYPRNGTYRTTYYRHEHHHHHHDGGHHDGGHHH